MPDSLLNPSVPIPEPELRNGWLDVFWVLAFGAVYVGLFPFAISLPFRAGEAACVWPADGLAVGVLMRVGYRQWPAYCIMIMVANALGAHFAGFGISWSAFT